MPLGSSGGGGGGAGEIAGSLVGLRLLDFDALRAAPSERD
jgi:hypothetical protein